LKILNRKVDIKLTLIYIIGQAAGKELYLRIPLSKMKISTGKVFYTFLSI